MKKTFVNWKRSAKRFAEKVWKCSRRKHETFKAIWAGLGHLTPKIFSVSQPWTSPHPPLPTILVLLRPWFYKPIKRHPNNINRSSSSVVNFEHVFVRWGIFKSNHSEKLWKLTLLKHLNFQGNMWHISSIVTVLFIATVFLRTPMLQNICERLLLHNKFQRLYSVCQSSINLSVSEILSFLLAILIPYELICVMYYFLT